MHRFLIPYYFKKMFVKQQLDFCPSCQYVWACVETFDSKLEMYLHKFHIEIRHIPAQKSYSRSDIRFARPYHALRGQVESWKQRG